ncbi:unnamed protein product [Closterium sp. NIES-64]|nr:unnamed protein product [Closterium sp. NIES-64]
MLLSPYTVLAAVREELAAHKEEVDELRHMLAVMRERNDAAAVLEREREFVVVKEELEAVKGELAMVKKELAVVKGELA